MWFIENHMKATLISWPTLKEQARHFHKELNSEEAIFPAGDGWLNQFKHWPDICQLSIANEIMSTSNDSIMKTIFSSQLQNGTVGLADQQIYITDETGFYWCLLPEKTLASSNKHRAPDLRNNKEHLTILACSNAMAECKLSLLLIRISANP